jgi:hypothetical protein
MRLSKNIFFAIVFLIVLVPLGLYTKVYSGFGHEFINNKLGGVFYEIFWCLIAYFGFTNVKAIKIISLIFLITCFLEFLQLADNRFLQIIRSNFIGRTIIGSSFSWTDFIYYAIGCLVAYYILKYLDRVK